MSEERKYNWVGTRPVRPDGLDKVTGRANYGSDMEMPGMLHGKVLRSPHAHARIVSIDLKPALAIEGVKAAVTADDLCNVDESSFILGYFDPRDFADNVLARGKALYDGHAVAAVAATTPELAQRGIEAIKVKYEVPPTFGRDLPVRLWAAFGIQHVNLGEHRTHDDARLVDVRLDVHGIHDEPTGRDLVTEFRRTEAA